MKCAGKSVDTAVEDFMFPKTPFFLLLLTNTHTHTAAGRRKGFMIYCVIPMIDELSLKEQTERNKSVKKKKKTKNLNITTH